VRREQSRCDCNNFGVQQSDSVLRSKKPERQQQKEELYTSYKVTLVLTSLNCSNNDLTELHLLQQDIVTLSPYGDSEHNTALITGFF
jgi:hypothetical protein